MSKTGVPFVSYYNTAKNIDNIVSLMIELAMKENGISEKEAIKMIPQEVRDKLPKTSKFKKKNVKTPEKKENFPVISFGGKERRVYQHKQNACYNYAHAARDFKTVFVDGVRTEEPRTWSGTYFMSEYTAKDHYTSPRHPDFGIVPEIEYFTNEVVAR